MARFAAACALSDVQDPAGLSELQAALRDDHRRQEALSAMMSLGDAAAVPAIAAMFEEESLGDFDRTLAAAALARLGDPRGGAHLISRLESDGDDRPLAAEWAGRLGVHDAIPVLTELAETEGDPARGAAIRALGRLKATGAEERLQAIAGDPDVPEDLRMDAAEGLAELATPAALDLLGKLAADGPPELKQLCGIAMHNARDRRCAFRSDSDHEVRGPRQPFRVRKIRSEEDAFRTDIVDER